MAEGWNDETAREVGGRIKAARKARGLSLQQVAGRLEVSKGTAGHWETGARTIKAEDLRGLCEVLRASADQLLFGRRQWPFSSIDLEAVQSLEPDEISQIEGAIKLMAAQMGLNLQAPQRRPVATAQPMNALSEALRARAEAPPPAAEAAPPSPAPRQVAAKRSATSRKPPQ